MLTNEDLQNIRLIVVGAVAGLEERMDRLEERIDRLEERMDRLEERVDSNESYMHKKFALIENDVIPKLNALAESMDLYVTKEEFRKRMDYVDHRLEHLELIEHTVARHSMQLERHERLLRKVQ